MPTYVYQCIVCDACKDVVKPLARLNFAEFCKCGATMDRILQAPAVRADYAPYHCPVTGRLISGKREHLENLKRTESRVLEPGEKEEYNRRRKQDTEKLDNAIDDTVEGFIHNLPTEKREQLSSEFAAGADVTVTRRSV